jgi:ribulose-5-phosphate 4-epimerase/fuculose-1-phosphate aldolase
LLRVHGPVVVGGSMIALLFLFEWLSVVMRVSTDCSTVKHELQPWIHVSPLKFLLFKIS